MAKLGNFRARSKNAAFLLRAQSPAKTGIVAAIMAPRIQGFDHIHLYVGDRAEAEEWYHKLLGFARVESLMLWADEPGGPLTVENPEGTVHVALFERDQPEASSAVAFAATGSDFLAWKEHLEAQGLKVSISDHQITWSMYFLDPWQNLLEITTSDHAEVTQSLKSTQ